jgi:hypothetical protein
MLNNRSFKVLFLLFAVTLLISSLVGCRLPLDGKPTDRPITDGALEMQHITGGQRTRGKSSSLNDSSLMCLLWGDYT